MNVEPEDFELLEFFASEPLKSAGEEGYFLYQSTDANGLTLNFSYHEIENSVQANLILAEHVIASYCSEGADQLSLKQDASGAYIHCSFDIKGVKAGATIQLKPNITVKWFTLLA